MLFEYTLTFNGENIKLYLARQMDKGEKEGSTWIASIEQFKKKTRTLCHLTTESQLALFCNLFGIVHPDVKLAQIKQTMGL